MVFNYNRLILFCLFLVFACLFVCVFIPVDLHCTESFYFTQSQSLNVNFDLSAHDICWFSVLVVITIIALFTVLGKQKSDVQSLVPSSYLGNFCIQVVFRPCLFQYILHCWRKYTPAFVFVVHIDMLSAIGSMRTKTCLCIRKWQRLIRKLLE